MIFSLLSGKRRLADGREYSCGRLRVLKWINRYEFGKSGRLNIVDRNMLHKTIKEES